MSTPVPGYAAPRSELETSGKPKDLSKWLFLFGIGELVLGGLLGMFAMLSIVTILFPAAGAQGAQMTGDPRVMLAPMTFYVALAAFFVVVGIGSIRGRRSARALMVVMSWLWVVTGVFTTLAGAVVLPTAMKTIGAATPTPIPNLGTIIGIMVIFMIIFLVIFMIILPMVCLRFYQSQGVIDTVQRMDPTPGWSDQVPLPVLALVIMNVTGALSYLTMSVGIPIIPVFGQYATGWAAHILAFLLAACWGLLAFLAFRLRPVAWWGCLGLVSVLGLSTFITGQTRSVNDLYQEMGVLTQQQVAMNESMGLGGSGTTWMTLAAVVPYLLYVLYTRRYFRPQPAV